MKREVNCAVPSFSPALQKLKVPMCFPTMVGGAGFEVRCQVSLPADFAPPSPGGTHETGARRPAVLL
jgi:hypothetical protein